MTWRENKVRRRLRIPNRESLVAWARADALHVRVPVPATGAVRRWPPYVALTGAALWVCRTGVTGRFGLGQVVMGSLLDEPAGALRVDFLTGEPLVVLLSDGGAFAHALTDGILAYDRELQRRAPEVTGASGPDREFGPSDASLPPDRTMVPSDGDSPPGSGPSDGYGHGRVLLHEAQLIVRRELRLVLTEAGIHSAGHGPG